MDYGVDESGSMTHANVGVRCYAEVMKSYIPTIIDS